MSRLQFGGGPEDVYLVPDANGNLHEGPGAVVQFYSAETGSNPITDLLDRNSSPITTVTTSTGSDGRVPGQIPPFFGPDGVFEMWASAAGSPRFLMQASNLGSYLGPVKDQFTQHAAQPNAHGTKLQDLLNVATAAGSATDGQALIYQASSSTWIPGSASASSAPGNMATTDTTQTISGVKTFSGAMTTTGGNTAKPSAVGNPARITQALSGQTGNVEEWRDSTGAAKAWVNSAFGIVAPNLGRSITFTKAGTITVGTGTFRWYNDLGVTLTIRSVRANIGTASTSGTPTVDVKVNGTTIYGTSANRPTVAVSALTSGKNTGFSTTTIADGSYLTADVVVAGTGAADLVVQVELV